MPQNDDYNEQDATQEFLNSLPEIEPGQEFCFACHPGVPCFNACCSDLNLMLTPYDLLRLRKGAEQGSEDFIKNRCHVSALPDTGFPMLHLRMEEDANKSCPFVRPEGCSIYPNRPSACRIYPVGRATRLAGEGDRLEEQYFLVQEEHCRGFEKGSTWTTDTWTMDQGLEPYTAFNERYTLLMAQQKASGAPLDNRRATMLLLALYQTDRFRDFIRDMRLFERVNVPENEQQAIMSDDEATLDFAMDWIELMLFGQNERLRPKE